jgi:Tol biopolymer transport system component
MNSRWGGAVILLLASGCTAPGSEPDRVLTPLAVRPEDPDTTNIQDQNDFMPSASPNGDLVLFTSRRSGKERLWVMNVDGSDQRLLTTGPGTQMQGSWSPDGERIVYLHMEDGVRSIAVINVDGSGATMLAEAPRNWPIPAWSPDGSRILYHAPGESGSDDLWGISPDGGEPEIVLASPGDDWQGAWAPDGRRIVLASRRDGDDFEIYVADLDGGPWTRLTHNDVDDYTPSWSPDGSRIVFQSPRADRWTIFTVKPDGTEETPITRYPMQWDPVWSHDGTEIFYNSARDGRRGIYVMRADGSYPRKLTNTDPGTFVRLVRDAGVEEAARVFRRAHANDPKAAFFYEREIQYLGENYLEMGFLRQALTLFEINTEAYPESPTVFEDLGDARLAAGQPSLAAESYARALQLDPENERLQGLLDLSKNKRTMP